MTDSVGGSASSRFPWRRMDPRATQMVAAWRYRERRIRRVVDVATAHVDAGLSSLLDDSANHDGQLWGAMEDHELTRLKPPRSSIRCLI
jgi:hypothetical protein